MSDMSYCRHLADAGTDAGTSQRPGTKEERDTFKAVGIVTHH